ncbi:MAG: methyltransferase [Azospirillum sp.]|nr:methyltransferase [Azospirillum sp.]
MAEYTNDYLLDKQIKIFQPTNGYRASSDAVLLSSVVGNVRQNEKILDLGSGTGAVSLCLAHRFPSAEITGFEIQPFLVELSNLSAAANNFDNLRFINQDLRIASHEGHGQFHHVVSNPPYAAEDMPSPNKSKACAHNFQNFSLAEWLEQALKFLRPQGYLYLVNRAEAIDEILFKLHGITGDICIIPLYSKHGQNAKRVLIRARKSSHGKTRIFAGLTIHQDNGAYTPAAQKILRNGCCIFDQL